MRTVWPLAPHVNEHRLARAAEGAAAALTDEEQRHVAACERCGRLLEGHRRAIHLLGAGWKRVDTPPAAVPFWRRGTAARWLELAAAGAIGVALTAALLYWRAGGPSTSVGGSPSPSWPPTAVPTRISEQIPTLTPMPATSPTAPNEPLDVPASIRANVESSWPSPMPTEQAHPLPQVRCSSWRVVLTDLDTGASRVVAQGSNPDMVNDPMAQDTPVPVVPTVALGDDALAYTTGNLANGIKLNVLTLSSGTTRTLPLGGPLEEMSWAGQDLAWVEDADLQAAGTGPEAGAYANPYYLGSQLMVLPNGASVARPIAEGAYRLDADTGEITWDTGGNEVWTARSPDWQPVQAGYESNSGPFISDGWLGWAGTWRETPFLILGPHDAAPRVVSDGLALSGGWLILGSQPGQPAGYLLITKLEVVPVSGLK